MITQGAVATDLSRRLVGVVSRAQQLTRALPPEQLAWSPAGGVWSADQLLDHVAIVTSMYLVTIDHTARGPQDGGPETPWQPSLMGGWLTRMMTSPRRFPAPRGFRPSPTPALGALERFSSAHDRLAMAIVPAVSRHWRRRKTSSPVAFWLRLNLGDCLVIPVAHAERHLQQIERLLRHERFGQ